MPAKSQNRTKSTLQERNITAAQLPRWTWLGVLILALAITATAFSLISSFSIATTLLVGIPLFLAAMFAASAAVEGTRRATDKLARYLVTVCFLLALLPLTSLIWEVVSRGLPRFDLTFFTQTQARAHDMNFVLGAKHALIGSLEITAIAVLISVPIGLFTAIYLVEYARDSRLAFGIRFFVDVMTGIPSIVAGLFAYTLFVLIFGPGTKTGMAGAVALSVLMIPTVVRSTEEMLRLVPNELREASYALGVPQWRTILRVVLPTAMGGIITGVVLGIARIIGETAPLLVTAGYYQRLNTNPFEGPISTLPVLVYQSLRTHGPRAEELASLGWTGALTLILIVMTLNLIGRIVAWKFAPKKSQ